MAKRFTDNEKWKKQFFKSLSTVNKLFFMYILDECDNAGIWHIEPDVAEIRIGESIDIKQAKKEFGKHIHEFDKGEKWFIPSFIEFQYGTLNPSVNAHKSAIDKLAKKKLTRVYELFINSSPRVVDKDKDKDMDMDMDKDKKYKHGTYQNVLLTKAEAVKLKAKFDSEYDDKINDFSEGLEMKGYKYKSHYLAILKWNKEDNKSKMELRSYDELCKMVSDDRGIFSKYELYDKEKKLWKRK